MDESIDFSFLKYACDIIADTNNGLTGAEIVSHCNHFAVKHNISIPYAQSVAEAPNKRTALRDNIACFKIGQQVEILKYLCELPEYEDKEDFTNLRVKLLKRYGKYITTDFSNTTVVCGTKHWLSDFPKVYKQYSNAITKFEAGMFNRNILDDMRLALELLVGELLGNHKTLENQKNILGSFIGNHGGSAEISSMWIAVINSYTHFQNNHVKHDENINELEVKYIIEITSVIMRYLIEISKTERR